MSPSGEEGSTGAGGADRCATVPDGHARRDVAPAGGATSLVIDAAGGGSILHWGAQLGACDLDASAAALMRPAVHGGLDSVAPVGLIAEHASGYPGRPGLSGSTERGTEWAPRFRHVATSEVFDGVDVSAVDDVAALRLHTTVRPVDGGVIVLATTLINDATQDYWLDDLAMTIPLPDHATELLRFQGRWCRELHPVRHPLGPDSVLIENRRGRTSHEHMPLVFLGTTGFGEAHGEVWGLHLAWSGNARITAGRLPDGRAVVQLGELLHPGEIRLGPGESYTTPPVMLAHSTEGLTPTSRQFHAVARSSPAHRQRPRPIVLNTWEAVYFDHDLDTLRRLAERAAAVGVERFVLDDGWFGGRRGDTAGLGDWWVSPDAHPGGLAPLIDTVTGLGMEFGIWVEPEMVNPDSDLYRAHPGWALADQRYDPVTARHQLVLDLTRDDAATEILRRLDALLADHDISFLKWDMNRDHVQATGPDGRAGTHAQTLALYGLLDELRRRHPDVEIESCASGGARIDLGILRRTERVWTSDCNDALERQTIQRWASTLIPPEVMGAHVGPSTSHTTGRTQSLGFRAATALFGHFGLEWNLLTLDDAALADVASWVELAKRFRGLIHGGDVVRVDHVDPHALVHGVVSHDRREGLFAYVQMSNGPSLVAPAVRLVGVFDPDRSYRVTLVDTPGTNPGRRLAKEHIPLEDGSELTGRQLAAHGLRPPVCHPESVELIHFEAVS